MDPGLARELARRGLLGQILIQSGSRYADDEESGVPAGAFVLDVDNLSGVASDQNDGIWDSDGPWATYSRLERELEAGMFMPGDTILIRAGDLVHRRVAYWTGGGTTAQADKILVMSWPGERCHFDFATNNDDTMLDAGSGTGPVIFEEGNFRLKSLDFTSYKRGFATRLNGPCPGCEFVDLTRTRFGSATSGGNSAGCLIVDGGADDYLIEGCDLSDGNEVSNNNGSTVYSIYSFGIVRGNHIGASGTMGGAYHLKRNNPAPTLGDWTFENNIVVRTGPSRLCCGLNNMDRSLIQHNLLVSANSGGSALYGSQSGTGASPWYANEVLHNTCFQVGLCGIDNNNAPNRRNGSSNVVYDNISDGQLSIMPNQIEYTHGNDLDYNLYSSDFFEFNATYPSLRSWRRNDRYFGAFAAHDDHSVEETVAWAGKPGVPVSHNDLSAFELSTISAGFKTASDMTNMGADLSLVGPAAYGY